MDNQQLNQSINGSPHQEEVRNNLSAQFQLSHLTVFPRSFSATYSETRRSLSAANIFVDVIHVVGFVLHSRDV